MNKEDGRKKQPFNEIDTECLDYIVNELRNNKSMQQMLNYYKGKYYFERYQELKKLVDKAIEYCEDITSRAIDISDTDYDLGQDFTARDILTILRGEVNESN